MEQIKDLGRNETATPATGSLPIQVLPHHSDIPAYTYDSSPGTFTLRIPITYVATMRVGGRST